MSEKDEPEIKVIRIGDEKVDAIDYKAPGRVTGMIVVGLSVGIDERIFPELEDSADSDD